MHGTLACAQADWKLVSQDQGIKVYSKSVADSKIKAVRVVCELEATGSQLVALLLDVESAEKWVYHTKTCQTIKQVSPLELFYYSEIDLPWPLDNRDFVAHVKVTQDKNSGLITVNAPAIPGFVKAKKGIVRVSNSKGYWVITPLGQKKVKIEYTLQTDPGGLLPAWVVNMFSAQGPLETFKLMREFVNQPKYKNASFELVSER